MTGTAYDTSDYTEITQQTLGYFECLSTWLFNTSNTINLGCLLVDISTLGGAVLIPARQSLPHQYFDLIIHSTEKNNAIRALLSARQRWTNRNYSSTYAKMGFEFCNMDIKKYQAIHKLIQSVSSEPVLELECSLRHGASLAG